MLQQHTQAQETRNQDLQSRQDSPISDIRRGGRHPWPSCQPGAAAGEAAGTVLALKTQLRKGLKVEIFPVVII